MDVNPNEVMYVGLPSKYPILEETLLKAFINVKLFLGEINDEVFTEQKNILPKPIWNTQLVYHTKDNIFACYVPFSINAIWLDLCNIVSEQLFSHLYAFIRENSFSKEGVFAITFVAARERTSTRSFYKKLEREYLGTSSESLKEFRQQKFPGILKKLLEEKMRRRVEIATTLFYTATSGIAMSYFSFKWCE